jgi:hypothetical protein
MRPAQSVNRVVEPRSLRNLRREKPMPLLIRIIRAIRGSNFLFRGGTSCAAPSSNGAATSSLPSSAFSRGNEDIAAPFPIPNGRGVQMHPIPGRNQTTLRFERDNPRGRGES